MFGIFNLLLISLQLRVFCFLRVPNVNETELKLAFFVHRHGDRTPLKETLFLSNNPKELGKLSQEYGLGEITKRGMGTGYKLGQFIRRRYGELLPRRFKSRNHYIRTTFSPRTVTTAVTSISGAYFMDLDSWTDVINWIPLPYYTVIPKYDYNAPFVNCPAYINMTLGNVYDTFPEMDQYRGLFDALSPVVPFNISDYPLAIYAVYDLYVSQSHLGMPLEELQEELLSKIKDAADTAADIALGSEKTISLQAGVLLHEFMKSASAIIGGFFAYPVQQYSAHDFNVYSFEAAARVTPRQGYPEYGSLMSLELRWDSRTDKFYVLPVYLTSPGHKEKYLKIKGCGNSYLCEFEKFVKLTVNNTLDIDTWRERCGFNEDTPINIVSLE